MVKVVYEKEDLVDVAEVALEAVVNLVDVIKNINNIETKNLKEVNGCYKWALDGPYLISVMLDCNLKGDIE